LAMAYLWMLKTILSSCFTHGLLEQKDVTNDLPDILLLFHHPAQPGELLSLVRPSHMRRLLHQSLRYHELLGYGLL